MRIVLNKRKVKEWFWISSESTRFWWHFPSVLLYRILFVIDTLKIFPVKYSFRYKEDKFLDDSCISWNKICNTILCSWIHEAVGNCKTQLAAKVDWRFACLSYVIKLQPFLERYHHYSNLSNYRLLQKKLPISNFLSYQRVKVNKILYETTNLNLSSSPMFISFSIYQPFQRVKYQRDKLIT